MAEITSTPSINGYSEQNLSRGTLRMNGVDERETRRTGLDRVKSARERERKKERD